MNEKEKLIYDRFAANDMVLSENQCAQFADYYEMLVETNKVMNLTAITDFEEVVMKHFVDSAIITKYFRFDEINSMIDVGTGAGFPGLPIKILYPQVSITLLDSLNKRIEFLRRVVDKLGLTGVDLVHGRAEDGGRNPKYREKHDLCVSRAVANLSTLSEYCTPFVKVGGYFISYKSGNVDEELEQAKGAIKILGCKTRKVEKFDLTVEYGDVKEVQGRSLVIMERLEPCKGKYPRKAGMPTKAPLK